MQFKHLSLSALIGLASAQSQSLNATLFSNNQTTSLGALLGQFPDLVSALSRATDITVLAPSNDAIAALLQTPAGQGLANNSALATAILSYHVLNGTYPASAITSTPAFVKTLLTNTGVTGGQVVEAVAANGGVSFFSGLLKNSTVVQADVQFQGGVIHVINSVLTLPEKVTTTARAAGLTSLADAVDTTGLAQALDTTSDLTIFAPNNDAFKAIGSALPSLTTEQLSGILSYHVVAGTVGYSSLLSDNQSLKTLNGANVTINIEGNNVFVNGARVVTPNVLVANGVVHVIDNVLNPAAPTAAPSPSATSGAPAFPGASSIGGTVTPGAAVPMATGAIGAAALFGAGVALFNI